jgi:hypothetical protein
MAQPEVVHPMILNAQRAAAEKAAKAGKGKKGSQDAEAQDEGTYQLADAGEVFKRNAALNPDASGTVAAYTLAEGEQTSIKAKKKKNSGSILGRMFRKFSSSSAGDGKPIGE